MNLYTYCSNNPIKYTDPTGHYGAEVHDEDTRKIAEEEFDKYLLDQCNTIFVYQTDSKGRTKYDKGKPIVDSTKTINARSSWMKEQKAKEEEYIDALLAGDQYVDYESNIFKSDKFSSDSIFHGLGGTKADVFIQDRKDTAASIITSTNYTKTGAIKTYITQPAKDILINYTSVTKATIDYLKNDSTTVKTTVKPTISTDDGKQKKDYSPSKYMDASKQEASLFVLGMGLHTAQDEFAHGMQTTAHRPTDPNDKTNYDYDEKLGWVKGTDRIDDTEQATRDYIDGFLYGDGTEDNLGYGSYLFTPYTPPVNKKK